MTLADRYAIQEVIGVGGMSAVYLARDLHFPQTVKQVAVKEMLVPTRDQETRTTLLRNFEREAHIVASLRHPAIPHIYDYFTQGERAYLVLEYIEGENLESILEHTDGFLPEEEVIEWGIALSDVLHYLHTHQPPVIFRDLKPANAMLTPEGQIVLVDFGIAKQFHTGQKGTMIGTEGYAPPEQYRGEATPQVDIYALGATLHHLLTRRDPRLEPPFSFHERPIREINPAVSPALEAVVMRALAYEPERRFQSALEMKEALLAVRAAIQNSGEKKAPAIAGAPQATVTLFSETQREPLWVFDAEDEIRGTPLVVGGAVYVGAYDHNLYALAAEDGKFLWKFPTEGGVVARPATDQRHLYFGSQDGTFYAVGRSHGRQVWRYEVGEPIYASARLAEGHLFFGADDGRLHAVHAITGRQLWAFEAGAPIRSTPALDAQHIYFGTEGGDLYCLDFRGRIRWRYRGKRNITASPAVSQNTVFAVDLSGALVALDAQSGWVLWRFHLGKGSVSSPAVSEGFVVLGSADGAVYGVNASRGREAWRYQTEHQVPGSPLIHEDAVYIGSADGHLYCLELNTGHLRWRFATNGAITGAPAIAEGVLYFGATDHRLYALPLA